MVDFVTVTLNPALDLTTSVDRILPFQKLRCGPMRRDAGGGGINVARVLERAGCEVLAVHTAGGPTGVLLGRLIGAEALRCEPIEIEAATREDFTVTETSTGQQFRFVEPGQALSESEIASSVEVCKHCSVGARFLVISGSLPPGSPSDSYARLIRVRGEARVVLDASGAALAEALRSGVYLVKPNLRELTELRGTSLSGVSAWVDACRDIVHRGQAQIVALTLAELGAIAVTAQAAWSVAAPAIEPISTVGAGDSFLGFMLWRLALGDSVPQALRYGVAAGSASLLSPGTSLCRIPDVERLHAALNVQEIAL